MSTNPNVSGFFSYTKIMEAITTYYWFIQAQFPSFRDEESFQIVPRGKHVAEVWWSDYLKWHLQNEFWGKRKPIVAVGSSKRHSAIFKNIDEIVL